jgi:hypothetical protein
MSALIDCIRAGALTMAILVTVGIGSLGIAFWQADAAQSEGRLWVRDGAAGCRYLPASQAIGAEPCQS